MDLNKNGIDDKAEVISAMVQAFSPIMLFLTSMSCLSLSILKPDIEADAKSLLNNTQNVTLTSGLALLGTGKRREKN